MSHFDEKAWSAILAHEDTQLEKPATAKAIASFEAKHDFALPDAHREFLLKGNGGVVGYIRLYGVGRKDHLDLGSHLAEMRPYIEGMADGPVLPFASDWGGSCFCYDLRKPAKPKGYPVLYWNHEYSEEPDDRPMLWSKSTADFVSFIKKVIKPIN
ncbi:SMI1/KNR4 family protein [Anatilimnocola floriformis]|uniref:SMI1/KNR4 family protein n=1 Tax=Anatilimnocola floriformis TaxID=2948575 RepID=UPI0020C1F90B|nr:SMI1/KNR4 family protein [Anatilimnocola floriformis]